MSVPWSVPSGEGSKYGLSPHRGAKSRLRATDREPQVRRYGADSPVRIAAARLFHSA